MNILISVLVVVFVIAYVLVLSDDKCHIGISWRWVIMRIKQKTSKKVSFADVVPDSSVPIAVCTDFGAFRNSPQKVPAEADTVIIMEDRSPKFFFGFDKYEPYAELELARHGPLKELRTQKDLRLLIERLRGQGKRVLFGFWGFWGDRISGPTEWLKQHPELKPRRKGESDIGNPFVILKPEGISFAQYIAGQCKKLRFAFGFDGLFLGDGLCGFRSFWNPDRYRDRFSCANKWADFYHTISQAAHESEGELWAYDCMGLSFEEARLHGVDYRLLAEAGLDVLVFQSYPVAWGSSFFKVPGKIGLGQDIINFQSVRDGVSGTTMRLYYTLEAEDSVEGWVASSDDIKGQRGAFDKMADGKLVVWANNLLAKP